MSEPGAPVHLPGVSTQGSCLSQGTPAVLSPNQPLIFSSTLVSRLLEKPKGAYSHAEAGLKLSVIPPAAHQSSHLWKARAWGPLPDSPLFLTDINLPHCWLASSSCTELPSPFLCSDACFSLDAPHHLPFIPQQDPITPPPPGWTTLSAAFPQAQG